MPKKGQKCSIGALNVPVVDRDIALRPFLTADSVSPPQNWSSMTWTVKSQNFDMILRCIHLTSTIRLTLPTILNSVLKDPDPSRWPLKFETDGSWTLIIRACF